jgi:hypothetical protein
MGKLEASCRVMVIKPHYTGHEESSVRPPRRSARAGINLLLLFAVYGVSSGAERVL